MSYNFFPCISGNFVKNGLESYKKYLWRSKILLKAVLEVIYKHYENRTCQMSRKENVTDSYKIFIFSTQSTKSLATDVENYIVFCFYDSFVTSLDISFFNSF